MIICLCKNISDKTVQLLIGQGKTSISSLQSSCEIGTGCGKCLCLVKNMLQKSSGFLSKECCATSANHFVEGAVHGQGIRKKRSY